jgi:hypothetical protein
MRKHLTYLDATSGFLCYLDGTEVEFPGMMDGDWFPPEDFVPLLHPGMTRGRVQAGRGHPDPQLASPLHEFCENDSTKVGTRMCNCLVLFGCSPKVHRAKRSATPPAAT